MRTLGFDRPLYVLPFDHCGSFVARRFGWRGNRTPDQTADIAATKQVIYGSAPTETPGILVDGQFGAAVLGGATSD